MTSTTEKGLIPLPEGGLGNQIFIYMAAYISSEYLKCPLYILNNNPTHHSYKNYNKTIFKNLGKHVDHSVFDIKSKNNFKDYVKHPHTKEQGYEEWKLDTIKPGMILHSYFQYYKTFEPYEEQIRQKLLEGLEDNIANVKNTYNFDDAAFVHVRRGDYLHFSDRHFIQPIEYYKSALTKLKEMKPDIKKVYLLSDDIPWIKKNRLSFSGSYEVKIVETSDELDALAIMALCKEGGICANSTFSWWGAFLGAHSERNPVFVPKKWYSTKIVKISPDEWIVL